MKPAGRFPSWCCFLLGAVICLANCSEKSTPSDTTAPNPPVLLPVPPDSTRDETGTDAIAEENWIQVVWLSSQEGDLAGYKIYRSSPPLQIPALLATKRVETDDPDTLFDDQTVQIGVRYSYLVTAFDQAGNESEESEEVNYMLIPKIDDECLISPRGLTTERQPIFFWTSTGESIENYLRVYDAVDKRTVWMSRGQNPFASPHEVRYNEDGEAVDSLLIRGHEYWWRVDRTGSALNSGSESRWVSFMVQ